MIDLGVHRVRATACALGETQTGKEQIGVELEFFECEGERLTWYGFFTDASLEITLRALRALGWQGDDITELDGVEDATSLLPSEAEAVVQEETYEGKTRLRVAFVNAAGGGVRLKQRLDPGKKAKLAERMKARILRLQNEGKAPAPAKATAPTTQAPPPTAPAPPMAATGTDDVAAPAVGDDEIPF